MKTVYERPKCLKDRHFHYCPGCGHGVIHKLIAEIIDELGIQDRTVGVAPVGCAVFAYWYYDVDFSQAAHGRAPAVATGIKRAKPDSIVFSYQGDGDLAAIGTAEIIHAANRGENITVIFVNNAIYGMTGGQMAPTTLVGQKASTAPYGRNPENEGYPIKVCELLSTLRGTTYLERTAITTPGSIIQTKKAIKKAFQNQLDGKGFSLVEVLSQCPTNWGMKPTDGTKFIKEQMMPVFPLGVYKDLSDEKGGSK
ncbi:MAG: 2-oxoglutarate oxidoreductase [Candidatus Muiribacterium halophilum]|uniref:2-oxoglutarate oxidoreductase n=1 Tax=Muiribacterium halophilum TaxID=2053465 RepID=A0A2N5ZC03_MUIH1|nr:MAG: 2-oxoglutarate oxidoreductase [Candidatus Muirbacterium halophilum]